MYFNAPHFDLPFRIDGTMFAEVEQDTEDDVYNCVVASLLTHEGFRPEAPNFGTAELVFVKQPLPGDQLMAEIAADEPRAQMVFDQNPNALDNLVAQVTLSVSTADGGQS